MGRNGPLLLSLLVLLLAGGAYNYNRNAHLDRELEQRPYRGLSEEDLANLESAYEAELSNLKARLERLGSPAGFFQEPSHRSDLAARVDAFERSQRANERWKGLRRTVLEREAELEAIRQESEIREAGLDRFWRRILRRVITL